MELSKYLAANNSEKFFFIKTKALRGYPLHAFRMAPFHFLLLGWREGRDRRQKRNGFISPVKNKKH